jgi:hypothetical protein
MLLGNYSLVNKNPGRQFGQDIAQHMWKASTFQNRFLTEDRATTYSPYAGLPYGYSNPASFVLPQKAGAMSLRDFSTGEMSLNGVSGLGGSVSMAGSGLLEATGGLLAGLEVTMSGIGSLTAVGGGLLEAIVSMAGSGTLEGAISAVAGITVSMAGVGTMTTNIAGTGEMELIIYVNQSQATVDQIVQGLVDGLGTITATVPNLLNTETGDIIIPLD